MNLSNICLIISYIYIVVFLSLGITQTSYLKEKKILDSYKNKIKFSLDSESNYMFDNIDQKEYAKLSNGDFENVNYENMYNEFVKVLKQNFLLLQSPIDITKYLDKYIVVLNEGLVINSMDQNGEREFSNLIPYSIKIDDEIKIFKLNDEPYMIGDIDYKQLAIVNTLRRNLVMHNENGKEIIFNIPFCDDKYSTIKSKSVIVTFKECPIINNKKVDIAVLGGLEFKDTNIYYINENGRYEKINKENVTEDMITSMDKKELGVYFYPEI